MNNLTTIISEMIENELEGILLDINNHVLDRLSNKIINEVREDERNRIFEALLSDEVVEAANNAQYIFSYEYRNNGNPNLTVDDFNKLRAKAVLIAAVEKIRGE